MSEVSVSSALEKAAEIAGLLVTVAKCIPELVDAAEKIYAAVTKSGASKKDMVLTILKGIVPDNLQETYAKIESTVSTLINVISKFRHGSSGTDPEVVPETK